MLLCSESQVPMTKGCTVGEILHMQGLGEKPDAKNVPVGAPNYVNSEWQAWF